MNDVPEAVYRLEPAPIASLLRPSLMCHFACFASFHLHPIPLVSTPCPALPLFPQKLHLAVEQALVVPLIRDSFLLGLLVLQCTQAKVGRLPVTMCCCCCCCQVCREALSSLVSWHDGVHRP